MAGQGLFGYNPRPSSIEFPKRGSPRYLRKSSKAAFMTQYSDADLEQILREEMEKGALELSHKVILDISIIRDSFDTAMLEAPRSTAILIAALVDDELTNYMRRQLSAPTKLVDRLFEQRGPFGTLSSKIDCAHALGWLGEEVWKNLHLIRKIRNEFAHNPNIKSFDRDPVLSHLNEMIFDCTVLERMGFRTILRNLQEDTRVRYLVSCLFTLHHFLRTAIVGPTLLQHVGGKRVYSPSYDKLSAGEKSVIDWVIAYCKKLENELSAKSH
jgi:DNA-binding MltR family transcriptional regulator